MDIVISFADGTEIWYQAEDVKICPDPYGMASAGARALAGMPERPAGPYVEIRGASLSRIAGVPV